MLTIKIFFSGNILASINQSLPIQTLYRKITENMEPNQLKTNWLPAAELILFLERGDLIEISRQSYTVSLLRFV